jgi:RNA polymerase sigma factor (sigma-70 family)
MDAERLAWALAFNVVGISPFSEPNAAGRLPRSVQSYQDRWSLDTPWTKIWSVLVAPLIQPKKCHSSTLLGELALSVACEQRNDWQHPNAEPIDLVVANQVFELLYARTRSKVVGAIYNGFGNRAGSPEAIANEAWSRVFCDYWSSQARRRFLGLCRISTLLCQVARYVAIDVIRDNQRFIVSDNDNITVDKPCPTPEDLGVLIDPIEGIAARQLSSLIKECVRALPAKQQIIAVMVWFRNINAKRAAVILKVSEPAISQHLKKARESVRACLEGHGFRLIR